MTESDRDIRKYSSHPVCVDGDLAALKKFLKELGELDRKAERNARLWLGPAALLNGPLNGWVRMSEPWRTLVGILTMPIWLVPGIILCTVFFPFTMIWIIGYALLARKDISNRLLQNCCKLLDLWEKQGPTQDQLSLTVDARLPAVRLREIAVQDLQEDHGPELFSAAEGRCFLFESRPLRLEVFQQYRVLHRKTNLGGKIGGLLTESSAIEGQSWYELHVQREGENRLIPGPVQSLPGRLINHGKMADFQGKELDPEFPWAEVQKLLSSSAIS